MAALVVAEAAEEVAGAAADESERERTRKRQRERRPPDGQQVTGAHATCRSCSSKG